MLTRWDPFSELTRLQKDLARRTWPEAPITAPAVDILEEDDALVLTAEVPGLHAEDLHVHVENDVLTLSGERRFESEEKKDRYHRIERSYGAFRRAFVLPKNVDGEAIQAKLESGVLSLRIPKKAPASDKRRIDIQG